MNLSATLTSGTVSHESETYHFLRGSPYHTATEAYGLPIFITVVKIVTCSLTIILNVLVIIAVKTKARLKTNPNIALSSLALTDVLLGKIAQPVLSAVTISTLQGETFNKDCTRQRTVKTALTSLVGGDSIRHLVLISVERYFSHKTLVHLHYDGY